MSENAPAPAPSGSGEAASGSLRDVLRYFLYLGTFGFGGPIALAGYMQRDLVEKRGWITKKDYVDGLALAQLAPGPLAAQLAIYLGWSKGRVFGATAVAAAFILPSFIMVLGLSALYVRFGGLSWMQSAFYGIGAAVIAIIARSALKLVKMTLAKDRLLWALFAASAIATAWTESEIIWLFLASGVVVLLVRSRRGRGASVASIVPPGLLVAVAGAATTGAAVTWPLLAKVALYFAEAGSFVFGSGLAIVPFMHGGVVNQYHWLTEQQFLDAVAVAMITPGPVVITVAFIGYLVAGPLGATAAAVGVFLPCYLFVIIPAPYFRRFADNPRVRAFVDGVTAAATGAIAGRLRARAPGSHRSDDGGDRSGDMADLQPLQEDPRAARDPGRRDRGARSTPVMTEAARALEVRNVSVTRGGRRVLDGVSFAVAPGEIVVAVGPNGAGKTTLLDTVIGAVPANGGGCFVGGRALGGLQERARWLGYLAGEAEPPPEVRVDVLLDDAGEGADDAAWIRALEARLGLGQLRAADVGTLSRGERRRVLLFEALAARKPFLLLDEPTGVFDPLQLLDIIDLLRQKAARGTGLLVTVHQMSDAEALASRILVLNEGRVISLGSMAELRTQAGVAATASLQETFLALLRAERPGREGSQREA